MRVYIYILLLIIFIFVAPVIAADKDHSFKLNGYKRKFAVHTPPSYEYEKKIPMVIVLHGGGGNNKQVAEQTKMNETADKYGFIVAYPEGIGGKFHTWNAGACCGKAKDKNVDDVVFISKMIDEMARLYNIDKKRVYSTGLSNGAMMSYRLSCELSDKITAIAPVAAQNTTIPCNANRAVPTIHFHGTADICARYDGGECGGCFADIFKSIGIKVKKRLWECQPVLDTIENRAKEFSCDAIPEIVYSKGDVTCQRWENCLGGAEVELCSIKNGGHNWPGKDVVTPSCISRPNSKICKAHKKSIGHVTQDININEAMWAFFSRFSL